MGAGGSVVRQESVVTFVMREERVSRGEVGENAQREFIFSLWEIYATYQIAL